LPTNNSIEQTPRSGENSGLIQASGGAKIIGDEYRRCSSRDRYTANIIFSNRERKTRLGMKRMTSEIHQEQISRGQLVARLSEFGWMSASPPDLGEDFIVSVYHDGIATGIGFYVQEKSVRDLPERKSGDVIKYRLEVKDLKHWEGFALPVVVIIWDIHLQEGRWILVKDIIDFLDTRRPQWRGFKTRITVDIPWANRTDDEGLRHLKVAIGDSVYPLISEGRDLELKLKLAFPDTEEGRAYRAAVDKHFKEGEPITLNGAFIERLEFSEWWAKWFGDYDPEKMEIHLGGLASSSSYYFDITLNPTESDIVSLQNLEFKLIQGGTDLLSFSNEHTAYPIRFMLNLRREGDQIIGDLNHSIQRTPSNPIDLMLLLNFKIAASEHGSLQVKYRNGKEQLYIGSYRGDPDTRPDPYYVELVEKLCIIQNKCGPFLQIPEVGIQNEDISSILEIAEIFENGFTVFPNATVTSQFKDKALRIMADVHNQGKPIHLRLSSLESHVNLFENQVQVGPMIRDITGFINIEPSKFEELVASTNTGEFIEVELVKCHVIEYFPDWSVEGLEEVLSKTAV
jgi:hypothetical protein